MRLDSFGFEKAGPALALAVGMATGCEKSTGPVPPKECLVELQGTLHDLYEGAMDENPDKVIAESTQDPQKGFADFSRENPELVQGEMSESLRLKTGFVFSSGYEAADKVNDGDLGLLVLNEGICPDILTCNPGGAGVVDYHWATNKTDKFGAEVLTTDVPLGDSSRENLSVDLAAYWLAAGCVEFLPTSNNEVKRPFGVVDGKPYADR